jgi:hypothetical protein
LKTRHGKVLTITGELLHLSEEDSKKVRTKNRRKKQDVSENVTSEAINSTEAILDQSQNQELTWEQQQVCSSTSEGKVQQCIDNAIWMYHNQTDVATEENYNEIQNKSQIKTDLNETEIENNFENNEVVIAQTDSDGTLHFENYNYAQDTVYTDNNTIQFSNEQSDCPNLTDNVKQFDSQEEAIVEYQECTDNYNDTIDPIFTVKAAEPENNVFVLNNEQMITHHEVATNSELKELLSTSNSTQTDDIMEINTNSDEQTLKIIPCQVKVCDNSGTTTLQLIKNSKIALLGNKTQSINLLQNGKQHTILLLASDENNVLELDNGIIEESKSLPVIAVPAE